jgi:hypothetical protein
VTNDELRELLKKSGVPAETVDNLDDSTLRQLYAEALQQENASNNSNSVVTNSNVNSVTGNNAVINTNATSNSSSNTNAVTTQDLENLSASDIRQLLISTGIPSATLDQFDDATLKSIFLEAMTSADTNTNQ